MWALVTAVVAHQPVELSVLPSYRAAQTQSSNDALESSAGDGHYAIRLRAIAHLRRWASLELDTTQSVLNLWFESEPTMQRYGRVRLTFGPRWESMSFRLRLGFGQESITEMTLSGRRYHYIPVAEMGAEVALQGPAARLDLGAGVFGERGHPQADLELSVPGKSPVAATVSYDYRQISGSWTFDSGPLRIYDVNHTISAGITLRPRVRRSP